MPRWSKKRRAAAAAAARSPVKRSKSMRRARITEINNTINLLQKLKGFVS